MFSIAHSPGRVYYHLLLRRVSTLACSPPQAYTPFLSPPPPHQQMTPFPPIALLYPTLSAIGPPKAYIHPYCPPPPHQQMTPFPLYPSYSPPSVP